MLEAFYWLKISDRYRASVIGAANG